MQRSRARQQAEPQERIEPRSQERQALRLRCQGRLWLTSVRHRAHTRHHPRQTLPILQCPRRHKAPTSGRCKNCIC